MHRGRLHRFRQTLRVEQHLRRVVGVMQMHVHGHVVDRRLVDAAVDMLEGRLMRELLRRKRRLLVHVERIEVRKRLLHGLRHMRVESMECAALMTGIQGAFRGGEGERSAQAHPESGRMQVAGLVVVQGARPARGGRVVAWHLVGEHIEALAVRIHHRRRQARGAEVPVLVGVSVGGVRILEIVRLSVNGSGAHC